MHAVSRWGRRPRVALAAAALVTWFGARALADARGTRLHVTVDYQAPADCADAVAFLDKLAARSANVAIVRAEEHTPRLIIRVTRRVSRSHGELVVEYPDGTSARRSVDGDACASVVDALALMSAMTLDPSVGAAAAPTPEVTAEPAASGANATTRPPDPDGTNVRVDEARGIHLALGAAGGAVFGVAPVAAPDALGFVELAWQNDSMLSPAVRLGFDYASAGTTSVSSTGGVLLSRTDLNIDGCPLRWFSGAFRFVPCAHLEGGALAASGVGVTPDRSAARPWLAAGLLGTIQTHFGRRFFAEVSGGVRVPLIRDHFYFEPDTSATIFQAPIVSGFAVAGVGLTIL